MPSLRCGIRGELGTAHRDWWLDHGRLLSLRLHLEAEWQKEVQQNNEFLSDLDTFFSGSVFDFYDHISRDQFKTVLKDKDSTEEFLGIAESTGAVRFTYLFVVTETSAGLAPCCDLSPSVLKRRTILKTGDMLSIDHEKERQRMAEMRHKLTMNFSSAQRVKSVSDRCLRSLEVEGVLLPTFKTLVHESISGVFTEPKDEFRGGSASFLLVPCSPHVCANVAVVMKSGFFQRVESSMREWTGGQHGWTCTGGSNNIVPCLVRLE